VTKWEYSTLLAFLTWQRQTPGDNTSPWTAPTTAVSFTAPDDTVTSMGSSPTIALNELGAAGWEVFDVDTDKALFEASDTIPIKNSSWVRRTFYLRRALEDA
jgi:hypothetical protein